MEKHSNLLELIEKLKQVESSCNPKLPNRCEKSWLEFFNWIDDHARYKVSDRFSITEQARSCRQDQNECALISKRNFKEGENIFKISRSLMLTTETLDTNLADFIKKDSIASTMQNVVLVLNLLNEYSKKDKSFWAPYLAILPNKILPVLDMNKEKLKYLLPSAHIFEALKMIRAIARQYSYFYERLRVANISLSREFTFQYYSWGVSIVCSRQNEIPPLDRKITSSSLIVRALIPILDMCNHNKESNQAIFENNESCLLASRELKEGEEVTINYGCRSSGDFYIHNGFVPDQVPFDIVPLTIALNKQNASFEAKAALLKTLNMPMFGRYRLTRNDYENRHKRDPHLTMFLIVYFMSEEELNFILKNDNPVGIADEVYEYVQYSGIMNNTAKTDSMICNNDKQETRSGSGLNNDCSSEVKAMKERIAQNIREYMSKRASISIALIDRTLNEGKLFDKDIIMLLKHEKLLFETYLIKNCSN